MSRPKYNFENMDKITSRENALDDICAKVAEELEKACFSKIEAAAYQVEHLDIVSEIKAVIEEFNKPDYFLIANVKNTEALEEVKKQFEELKIKILYSPLVNETTFYLIKYGAITQGVIYPDVHSCQLLEYEFRVDHPEFITKVIIDE